MSDLPPEVDWVRNGFVTPVKDQGTCGACWAFAATGAMEGAHRRVTGRLVALSEQNLIDCSQNFGTTGCLGGASKSAFKYVIWQNGIQSEASYQYKVDIVFSSSSGTRECMKGKQS